MSGQAEAMQADIDWLNARQAHFVAVACPACDSDQPEALYQKYGMQHLRCGACATQYVSPRPTAPMLGEFYANSSNYAYWAEHIFPKSREARRQEIFAPRAELVRQLVEERSLGAGVLVEVGAAHGLFCEEIAKLNLFDRIVGIEPTPDLADECRKLGIETIEAPVETVELELNADVVASFEVIEHLYAPADFLRWCFALLKPGGHVLLTCPNIQGFETMLLKRASGSVDHEHLNLMHPRSLASLAVRCGFEAPHVTTPGRLDVEIVRTALTSDEILIDSLPEVIRLLVGNHNPAVIDGLQDVIRLAGLSSNMMLVARRPLA